MFLIKANTYSTYSTIILIYFQRYYMGLKSSRKCLLYQIFRTDVKVKFIQKLFHFFDNKAKCYILFLLQFL